MVGPLIAVPMIVPPTPGPIATPMLVWVSFTATEPGQPERLQRRIVPAAGSVLRVSVMLFAAARMGANTPGMPWGPARAGLIRTPWKRISSMPTPGVVALTVRVIFANGRVRWSVLSGPLLPLPDPLAIATPVPDAVTSLITPLCENLIACSPENSSLSACAAPASANASANAGSAANCGIVRIGGKFSWRRQSAASVPVEPPEINRISEAPGGDGAASPGPVSLADLAARRRRLHVMAIYEPIEPRGLRRRYRLRSPVDPQPIGALEGMTAGDLAQAAERARKAQPAWAAVPIAERAALLRRVLARVLEGHERITSTVIRETGKTETEAFAMEVFASCDALNYYAKNAARFLRPEKRRIHGMFGLVKQLRCVYKPLGVVGIIVPWNGPFVLAMNQAAQAIVAGNAVLLKGSEVTPYSSALVGEFFAEAGLPEGVLEILTGDGQTGADLVNAGVNKISFTGSVATGRKVAEACGRQLIPVTLELGGKDAMIVCADADLDRAAAGALIGSCMNTGQY